MKQGQQQQRYRVLDRLASGGMAEVYLAESAGIEGFKKRVAIKRVLPHLSEKKRFIAMFLDEARLSAHLTHSNVAQVFDIGVGDNAYFIVMEYVDGSDLKAIIDFMRKTKRSFPVEVAVHIAEKICEGLSYAHEAKNAEGQPLRIVHRDVSPANVLITKYGEIKIVDFGLAKATNQLEKSEPGIVKGKFGYLSPEATQGIEVDARTDVFAVGIILWEILAQRRLFLGENDLQTVMMVREAIIPLLGPLNKEVPAELEKIINRALARDPDKRYPNARELGRDLNSLLFKLGKPVGSHDVAELVSGTVALRKTSAQEKDTTLHKLIEAALLEFNSLQDDQSSRPGAAREKSKPEITPEEPKPRGRVSHFEDIGKWAEEMEVSPVSGEARSARFGPASAKKEAPVESKPIESKPVESLPAATVRATPQAKTDEGPAVSAPAETVRETPLAKAEESPAPSSKPKTNAPKQKKEKSLAAEEPARTGKGAKAKKRGEAKLSRESTAVVTKKKATSSKPAEPAPPGKVMWLYVAAAILLLVASAYYGGLFTP